MKPTSKIVGFASDYTILHVTTENDEGIFWIFRRVGGDYAKYPENTSLQKAAKSWLMEGNHIGSALGVLKLPEKV